MVNTYLNSKKKNLAIVGCFGCLMVGVLYFFISGGLIEEGKAYTQIHLKFQYYLLLRPCFRCFLLPWH